MTAGGASTARNQRSRTCAVCGGEVLDDGFCGTCGQKALSERDHWSEHPTTWIGGTCDKGILHARNEDAMALAGSEDGSVGVLVVCDGVTSAPDSDRASLAAARAACALLISAAMPPPEQRRSPAGIVDHVNGALVAATGEANSAAVGVARTLGNPKEPPSCTFVAAVMIALDADSSVATVACCGDSRAYWLPDAGEPAQLTTDHSLGTEMIRGGMSQAEAEATPTSHTITRWLGADSIDPTSEITSIDLNEPGWMLVCSDGLWNYATSPAELATLVHDLTAAGTSTPGAIAEALVAWANEQGGQDNITAALARFDPSLRSGATDQLDSADPA
jgi:serine/threonine protein phosphatase PrpC